MCHCEQEGGGQKPGRKGGQLYQGTVDSWGALGRPLGAQRSGGAQLKPCTLATVSREHFCFASVLFSNPWLVLPARISWAVS